MAVLPNMGINTPTLGGDSGTWDDKINAALALIDAHDHTSGKGVAIVSSGITVDADIPMAGFGLTSLGKLSFSTIAAPSTGSKNLFVNTADNELYWRSNAGANVKLTSGSSLNTSLVGGIVGDYSSVGAEVAFDDTNKRYTFKDQTAPTKKWARLASGPVRIFEYNTTESVYVEHAAAAALASSYTVTWPAALPGAQTMVQIGASGDLVYSNTIPADTNITMSGTGHIVHGDRTRSGKLVYNSFDIIVVAGTPAGTNSWNAGGPYSYVDMGVGGDGIIQIPVTFNSNERLKTVTMYFADNTNANTQMVVLKGSGANGSGLLSVIASTGGGTASAVTSMTCTITTPELPTYGLWVRLSSTGGSTGPKVVAWSITYDVT